MIMPAPTVLLPVPLYGVVPPVALTVTVAANERREVEIDLQPAAAKETAEVRTQPGSLSITSQVPGVEVWLRDQKIGETRPGRPLIAPLATVPGTARISR